MPRSWGKLLVTVLFVAGTVHLSTLAHRASHRFESDYRNPYVYAQPLSGVVRLARWIEKLANVHADGKGMFVQVLSPNPWPLPFYLRGLERVGYWEQAMPPLSAPVVVVSSDLGGEFDSHLLPDYQVSHYGLRPDVQFTVYVEPSLWRAFVAAEKIREER